MKPAPNPITAEERAICKSKHPYFTQEFAKAFALLHGHHYYKCRVCGYWHETSQKASDPNGLKLVPRWVKTRADDPHYKVRPVRNPNK